MPSDRSVLERQIERVELRPFTVEGFHRRRQRKERNRRVGSAVVALVVAGVAIGGLLRAYSSGTVPADDPRAPFLGTWELFAHNSLHTLEIRVAGDGTLALELSDEAATVCDGLSATETGVGTLSSSTEMTATSQVITCQDGTVLKDVPSATYTYDPETDFLTGATGEVWRRSGADPSPAPTMSGGMWPQSSLEEVQEAQRLADAGDPRAAWQVDPQIEAFGGPIRRVGESFVDAEIVARFLREELGWEEFRFNEYVGWEEYLSNMTYVRCAPGGTNPLYPEDPYAGGCAPTIDDLRYETVHFDLTQPGRQGPSGIWVVSNWETGSPFSQMVSPTDAEAAAHVEAFLQARIDGEGAEEFLGDGEVPPLLYATTAGAPYERSEFERVAGPRWPFGDMGEFKVRLFAEGGETVVEQLFFLNHEAFMSPEGGRLGLEYLPRSASDTPTTENGQGVAVPYSFLDGEVTYAAAWPWAETWANFEGLLLDGNFNERLELVADPVPVETGCEQSRAPADAEALARSIRFDPDLEATTPVAVSVGGIQALWMDVVLAPGASVCEEWGTPLVLKADDLGPDGGALEQGQRMRLYLLDLPVGLSARTMAIAIVAPESRFEAVMGAAAPIVDSFEFRTG